jgi:glucose-6-phosphate 1-dehydrogenase
MTGQDVELYVAQQQGDGQDAYEGLISAALIGDTAHFAREDEVEAAWAIVDPVLNSGVSVDTYTQGTWGPAEAERLLQGPCGWHNPGAKPEDWARSCGQGRGE